MNRWMSSLRGLGRQWAATQKTTGKKTVLSRPIPLLLNDNLRFQANNFQLFMIPKHPKLAPGSERSIVIDTKSVVLQLFFVKKSANEQEEEKRWQESEAFELKFDQLAGILDIEAGKGQEYSTYRFSTQEESIEKNIIKIRDDSKEKRICFSKTTELTDENSNIKKGQFQQSISYEDFDIMQSIIEESLYDLSGMRLILDIKRMEELESLKKIINDSTQKMKEAEDFYGNERSK